MNQSVDQVEDESIHKLEYNGKEIFLVGTAHVSHESVHLVRRAIEELKPDTVCVELCASRFQAVTQENRWQETDLFRVVKEKKAFLLLANLILASFQKRLGNKFGIKPGQEMIEAINVANGMGATIHLADRDVRTTLARAWRKMKFMSKVKLTAELITSFGEVDELTEEDIENLKKKDVLEAVLSEVGDTLPEVKAILIDERDQYLTQKIKDAPGNKIVAVVGAGHVPGIQRNWETVFDLKQLEVVPPKGKWAEWMGWIIPLAIVGLIVGGFFKSGFHTGTDMLLLWFAMNSVLAGLGAAAALAHPLTIFSAVLSAPFTAIHPLIAVGWVSGLVEAFLRKPKVKDFETLPMDISTVRGFWRNAITRILLVVILSNLGASIGTLVAIPLMVKALA